MINLKHNRYKLLGTSLLFSTFSMLGCENPPEVQPDSFRTSIQQELKKEKTSVFYGPSTNFLGGTARTWVEMVNGKPAAIGIELSEAALEHLDPSHGTGEHSHEMAEYSLKLPGQAHATGIKTIMVGWNPEGHPPVGTYNLPHFDFHFYMQTEGQIKQIQGGPDEAAKKLLARGVLPEKYDLEVPGEPFSVPHMGVHWVDYTSAEFTGKGFSKTFIYGSDKDKITFLEPMITLDYLLNLVPNTADVTPVPALRKHEDPGYYPASYMLKHDTMNKTYTIALTELERHNRNK